MSNFRDGLWALHELATAVDGVHRGATIDDIETDQNLRIYLAARLDRSGVKGLVNNPAALQAAVLATAERSRGSELRNFFLRAPAQMPLSLDDHQYLNLVERLYLSAPGNYGKEPLFGDSAAKRSSMPLAPGGLATVAVAAGALAITAVIRRRRKAALAMPRRATIAVSTATAQRPQSPMTPLLVAGGTGLLVAALMFAGVSYMETHSQSLRMPRAAAAVYGLGGAMGLGLLVGTAAAGLTWLFVKKD